MSEQEWYEACKRHNEQRQRLAVFLALWCAFCALVVVSGVVATAGVLVKAQKGGK